ncbi:MAG: hypothetical protein Q8P75_03530, partial [bacterium]|nr:hypothetical protein [bacterium]
MKTKHYALLAFLLAATLFTGEARAASALGQRLSGKILLQVEANGEGWYIYPKTFKRYYLGRPDDAFRIMRELSLGISNNDFENFGMYAPSRLRGLILLKVEDAGRAYYVHPDTRRMHYLGRPQDAFDVMRTQGLGITNKDLASLEAENGYQNSQPQKPSYPISAAGWKPPSTCSGTDITFTSSPVPVSEIYHIEPMGKVAAGHVTPTDHGYIANSANHQPAISDLRAPADGHIVSIGAFGKPNDYRIIIWHSCTVSTIYIHVHELAPEILAITGDLGPGKSWEGDHGPDNNKTPTIPVKAGQVIGKMNRSLDFSVHDTAVALAGFENPALYYGEQWKIHTVDLFGYFESSLRSQLKAKSLRAAEPVGGKIDFD